MISAVQATGQRFPRARRRKRVEIIRTEAIGGGNNCGVSVRDIHGDK
jgi:hypothetical protein